MAITDMERLIISLEARTRAFEKQLKQANATAQRQLRSIEKQFADTNKKLKLNAPGGVLGGLRGAGAGALGAAFGANEVVKYADAWVEAGNKIAAASQISGKQARSLRELNGLATETRSGLEETVDLYAKLLRATKDVAQNEAEVAQATEIVNKAFKAGGAAASEQAAGVLQLSQALGSGFLQGDELRSLRENAPLIAQAIADEFGTTIAGLKELGAEGKLTTDRVFKAILNSKAQIDRAFGTTTATIGDGMTLLKNAGSEAAGRIGDVTGASKAAGDRLAELADIVLNLTGAIENIAGSPAGKFLGFLSDVLNKLEPINRGLQALANADKVVGKTAEILDPTLEEQIKSAHRAVDRFFKAVENGVKTGFLSKEQGEAMKKLRQELIDGKHDAESAKKAVDAIGAMKPGTEAELGGRFDPLMDSLTLLVKKAEEAEKAVNRVGLNTDDRADSRADQRGVKAYSDFMAGRNADAKRTELERQIDERTKDILEGAEKLGVTLTEAAARIQAKAEIAAEESVKTGTAMANSAMELIKRFEGFRTKAYWDVNAYRVGYGSDRTTAADGSTGRVASNTTTTIEAATRDLARRVAEFQRVIERQIGADTFRGLGEDQQAALTSIAYNYGELPDRIVNAILRGGDVATAIRGLGGDNGGINRNRRNEEADIYAGGMTPGNQASYDWESQVEQHKQRIAAIQAEIAAMSGLNPLVKDYGYAVEKARVEQELLQEAQAAGKELTPELRAKIAEMAEEYAKYSAAAEQAKVSQENFADTSKEFREFGKGLLSGFISDLREGKSASEALANALNKVGDKLLDIALNSLFGLGGAGGGLGFLSFIPKLFGFEDGGIARNGRPVMGGKPMKRYARGGVAREASIFGEAGTEAAVPLPDGRSIPVTFTGPKIPRGGAGGGVSYSMPITINAPGADAAKLEQVRQEVRKLGRDIPAMVDARNKTRELRKTRA